MDGDNDSETMYNTYTVFPLTLAIFMFPNHLLILLISVQTASLNLVWLCRIVTVAFGAV